MLGIVGWRFALLVAILLLVAALGGSFIGELAIINGQAIVAAFVADFLRYSLALLTLLIIAASVAEDYEFRQFERLPAVPGFADHGVRAIFLEQPPQPVAGGRFVVDDQHIHAMVSSQGN